MSKMLTISGAGGQGEISFDYAPTKGMQLPTGRALSDQGKAMARVLWHNVPAGTIMGLIEELTRLDGESGWPLLTDEVPS